MRPVWSGALSFGLVNIPIKLYSAVQDRSLHFHMLHKKDFSPVRYARICKVDGKEIPYEDIVKGYEYQKGDFVVLTEDDFKKANVRETSVIDIQHFVEEKEIDPKYFEKPYYIEPAKGADRAYALLISALAKSKKVAVAKYVIHKREHLGAVKPDNGMLVLYQMRFDEEIREPEGIRIPEIKAAGKQNKEVDLALQLIEQLTVPFDPSEYKDTYVGALEDVIDKKVKGKKPVARGKAPEPVRVDDIMKVLRESLAKEQKKHPKPH